MYMYDHASLYFNLYSAYVHVPFHSMQSAPLYAYSVSPNFCLQLIEPSAKEIFNFWTLVERETSEEGEENKVQI